MPNDQDVTAARASAEPARAALDRVGSVMLALAQLIADHPDVAQAVLGLLIAALKARQPPAP